MPPQVRLSTAPPSKASAFRMAGSAARCDVCIMLDVCTHVRVFMYVCMYVVCMYALHYYTNTLLRYCPFRCDLCVTMLAADLDSAGVRLFIDVAASEAAAQVSLN